MRNKCYTTAAYRLSPPAVRPPKAPDAFPFQNPLPWRPSSSLVSHTWTYCGRINLCIGIYHAAGLVGPLLEGHQHVILPNNMQQLSLCLHIIGSIYIYIYIIIHAYN
jgi:hypothetical protein